MPGLKINFQTRKNKIVALVLGVTIISLLLGVYWNFYRPVTMLEANFCQEKLPKSALSLNDSISKIRQHPDLFFYKIDHPDKQGNLGRNKNEQLYSSPDFQRKMWELFLEAVETKNTIELDEAFNAMELPFNHMLPNGDFVFTPFTNVSLNDQNITGYDGHSGNGGNYFFMWSVGITLQILKESDWFNIDTATINFRERLKNLTSPILKAEDYLSSAKNLAILDKDVKADNRIWIKAIAFYGPGIYVNNANLTSIGTRYAKQALSNFDSKTGIFSENGGGDTSYQGVNLLVASQFSFLLPSTDPLKTQIQNAVICGSKWEINQADVSGKISVDNNTRVKANGEKYYGTVKNLDVWAVNWGLAFGSSFANQDNLWQKTIVISNHKVFYR